MKKSLRIVLLRTLPSLILVLSGTASAAEVPSATDQLTALFAEEWAFRLVEDPLLATSVGVHRSDDLLPSVQRAASARRVEVWRAFLSRLAAIDRGQLSESDLVSSSIFERQLRGFVEEFEIHQDRLGLTVDGGFHIAFARLPKEMPFETVQDYENYIARLRAFPAYVAENVDLLRDGLAHGMTLPRVVLEGYEVTISSHVVEDPMKSLFYTPFENLPDRLPEDTQQHLKAAGKAAIREGLVPGYRAFLEFMVDQYIPGARTSLGASAFPEGAAYYAQRIRHFTTLDLTAQEIHQLGHREVARIRADMMKIIQEVEFDGDFAAFLQFLRTDPRFYATTPEELLKEAAYLAKRADAALPAFFGVLPRTPYGVAPVPDHLAPKYTSGRYVGSAPGSTQPGYYWVNTYALESRPLYVLPALTLHEAVPGHHLQISLNQELESLPPFRRYSYISAFGEGWGLYSEWLGIEMGMYSTPYSRFGRLTYEMWRACRLVVDTGLHAMGWSRQQAMDFLAMNTALSLHEVRTETDRYISWPGQALSYKLGELKIRQLRQRAEEALGDRFDIRQFHDVVLSNGSIPLTVLEEVIDRYIERQRPQAAQTPTSP